MNADVNKKFRLLLSAYYYMDAPECGPAGEVFYDIAFGKERTYQHQGWLSGRVTTDDNFTLYRKSELGK